ncbi:hypothetical protein, partial [Bacteroides finegoldii]|uniref:hypothetical protein n=1 Tax=Bacteroides finegoldii TaxID=338188 RepID=UPI001E3BF3D6
LYLKTGFKYKTRILKFSIYTKLWTVPPVPDYGDSHVACQAGDMDCQELIQVCPMACPDAVCPFRQRAAACFCVCGS